MWPCGERAGKEDIYNDQTSNIAITFRPFAYRTVLLVTVEVALGGSNEGLTALYISKRNLREAKKTARWQNHALMTRFDDKDVTVKVFLPQFAFPAMGE